jgi:hypothetical protein
MTTCAYAPGRALTRSGDPPFGDCPLTPTTETTRHQSAISVLLSLWTGDRWIWTGAGLLLCSEAELRRRRSPCHKMAPWRTCVYVLLTLSPGQVSRRLCSTQPSSRWPWRELHVAFCGPALDRPQAGEGQVLGTEAEKPASL